MPFAASRRRARFVLVLTCAFALSSGVNCVGHGTVVFPKSRAYRVYQHLNGSGPSFPLAANAILIDGPLSYYTWNEVSRNISQAVTAGLPAGFDYSPWMPDGELASAGRTDPNSTVYPRTYAGLDQVSQSWPTTSVIAGSTITVDFHATAPHNPSVWDVWMTRPTWDSSTPLTWAEMEFLGRPTVNFANSHYTFDLTIPSNRSGHHVLWVAWQRNDPVGEVFISTSDIDVQGGFNFAMTTSGGGVGDLTAQIFNMPPTTNEGFTLVSFDTTGPVGLGPLFGLYPDQLTIQALTSPAASTNPLHFVAPFVPGTYPVAPFSYPPGALASFAGMSLDGQVFVFDATNNFLGATGVSRVTF